MTEILITLSNLDGSDNQIQILRDLIQNELDRCPVCREIQRKTDHLPYHCNNCFTRRDERWLRSLEKRALSALKWNVIQ
jgi:hypothetical protein